MARRRDSGTPRRAGPATGRRRGAGSPPGAGANARALRLLLLLYPAPFRGAWGEEMTRFFLHRVERARREGGRRAVLRLWIRTTIDIVWTAAAERRRPSVRRHGSDPGRDPVTSLIQDLRYAGRRLRRTPLFTLSAIAILAVGIGLNGAVFGIVDTILFRPPPYEAPEEIVHIYQDSDGGEPSSTSFPAYRDMAAMTDVFTGVAATSSSGATWDAADGPRQVSVDYATASYFPVLGLRPHRGRWFGPEHDVVGTERVAVVSYHTWRTQLGADPDVVGRTIRLNNQPVTIIGVGPESFSGDAGALLTDFWLSISSTPVGGPSRVANLDRREDHWYQVKARLAPGVGIERARSAMDALAARLAEVYPELNRGRDITVFAHDEVRFHPSVDAGLVPAGLGLFLVAGLVLLLACSNLANLLLVRGLSRGPEMAVRRALGAGRKRVARLMLMEALLLSGLGGAAGLALAAWALTLVPSLPLPVPAGGLDLGFDGRLVAFGVLLSLVTGILFGLLPAVRATRPGVAAALREEGRGRSAGRGVSLLRGGLVAVQVTVSVVLVVGAGLLARSLARAERVDPGVDAERVAVLSTNLQQGGVPADQAAVVMRELLDRVEALPGVERAAITTRLPVENAGTTTQIVDGYDPPSGTGSVELAFAVVSRGYFETMGIPLLAGRTFTEEDGSNTPRIITVNETAARVFWGGDAVGGRIRPQGDDAAPWREVVGVVGDVNVTDIQEAPTPMIYYAAEQVPVGAFTVVARTPGDPAALSGALRRAVQEVRPSLPVTRLGPLEAHLGAALAGPRAAAALMGAFSLVALLLASLGVYAVVAFTVQRRTQELGIRLALGATRARLTTMVIGESLVMVGLGVGAGLAVMLAAGRALEGLLFGVGATDAITFASAALLMLLTAGAAAFLPARRAARADPVAMLRKP